MLTSNTVELRKLINSKKSNHYVYSLNRPNGEVFYIGVGKGKRVLTHFYKKEYGGSSRTIRKSIIDKIRNSGEEIKAEILGFFSSRVEAERLEIILIKSIGRLNNGTGILANMTDGGEGTLNVVKTLTEEAKIKLSMINKGKVLSEETKRKMSESRIGLERTKDHCENLSKSLSKVPIFCIETKEVFQNLREAEEWLKSIGFEKADRKHIHRAIKKSQKHCGYSFDYYKE